jgi:hypothetical protein
MLTKTAFELAYSISPILLSGGIAANIPGGLLPITALLAPAALASGLLGGGLAGGEDSLGAFSVVPGGTLINNQIGMFPFANQSVAANAIIVQPLELSLMLTAPAQAGAGYLLKIATFSALQVALAAHSIKGGTYMVATPSFLYQNMLLLKLIDVSGTDSTQVQYNWQFDFIQPLVTKAQAASAQNTLLSKISGGQAIAGDPPPTSGLAGTQGLVSSGAGPALIPTSPPVNTGLTGSGAPLGGG